MRKIKHLNKNKNNILILNKFIFIVKYFFTVIILFFTNTVFSQQDSLIQIDTLQKNVVSDTLSIQNDKNVSSEDSVKNDAVSRDAIDQVIDYSCKDSILFSFTDEKMFLFGSGDISAKEMDLKSSYVEISTKDNYIYAKTVKDTTGENEIKPILKQDDESFTVSSIKYNFTTKKALVKDVKTEMEQGYLHSDVAKMQTNKEFHIKDGKFTTCDLDHPHFYIKMTKAKKIPDKHVISGPMYFVIADIPLYVIGLPFGILPNQKKNSSGLLIPEYGEEQRGFFLRNGGYFWAINDYINAAVTGSIYSKGSWGLALKTDFKRRYKYNGFLELKYDLIRTGEKILIDTKETSSYSIRLNYSQDAKANPNGTFSASVDYGQNFELTARDLNDLTNSTRSSNIAYRWSKPGSIYNFNISLRGTQNTKNNTVNFLLPSFSFNIKRQTPFKNLGSGTNKWYQKIGYTFSLEGKNSLTTSDSVLFQQNDLLYKMKNGLRYRIPINTSFTILNYINVSPSLNFTGRLYSNLVSQKNIYLIEGNEVVSSVKNDTIYRVSMPFDFNFSFPLSTKVYGIFNINKGRIQAIRHVMSPSVSFSFRPDFSRDFWNFYGFNELDSTYYSYYQGYLYGSPPSGKSGAINFSLGNNFEMKLKNNNDTVTESKKINLLDNLNMGISYNLAADSLNFSNFSVRGNTKLFKNFNLSFGADFDPYVRDSSGLKINTYEWDVNHRLFRFNTGRMNLTGSLKPTGKKDKTGQTNNDFYYYQHPEIPYVDFDIPWNFSAGYNLNIVNVFDKNSGLYQTKITQTANISGNFSLTQNWKITAKTNFDIVARKFSYAQFSVYRDLHCWEMTFNVIPFGTLKSYSFRINIKSNVFKGIEYNKRKEWDKSPLF